MKKRVYISGPISGLDINKVGAVLVVAAEIAVALYVIK